MNGSRRKVELDLSRLSLEIEHVNSVYTCYENVYRIGFVVFDGSVVGEGSTVMTRIITDFIDSYLLDCKLADEYAIDKTVVESDKFFGSLRVLKRKSN